MTGDYQMVFGRDPMGNLVNLTPETPSWAGPATYDPNAPLPVAQASADSSGSSSNRGVTGVALVLGCDPMANLVRT